MDDDDVQVGAATPADAIEELAVSTARLPSISVPDQPPVISRSPRQASRVFGFDQASLNVAPGSAGNGPPRPKFLFLVRFVRGAGEGSSVRWQDGLSFAVKRFDRPRISPKVQMMNQYNKKRLIQTGMTFSPVSIEFHDTVDGNVSQMWHEYARYHYGDFRRGNDYDWKYDITTEEFFNTNSQGFGFNLPPGSSEFQTEESFFFESVECYQFFGGQYTQVDLIHPKIASFEPDTMDYQEQSSHTIKMSLEYETVIYHNDYIPTNISDNPELVRLFGDILDGDVYEPPDSYPQDPNEGIRRTTKLLGRVPNLLNTFGIKPPGGQATILPPVVSQTLSSYGQFDFGDHGRSVLGPVISPIQELGQINSSDQTSQIGSRTDNTPPEVPL